MSRASVYADMLEEEQDENRQLRSTLNRLKRTSKNVAELAKPKLELFIEDLRAQKCDSAAEEIAECEYVLSTLNAVIVELDKGKEANA